MRNLNSVLTDFALIETMLVDLTIRNIWIRNMHGLRICGPNIIHNQCIPAGW